jgi:BirA family biotin operon repressor/biotin-[acetyl-CoA-carboxylase] ligase
VTHHEGSRPPLDRSRLDAALGEGSPWRAIDILDGADSTNAVATDRAAHGADPGLVVIAEHQTSGRGRLDRTWVTPDRAALTFSVLVRPDLVPAARWPWLPLLAGVGVVESLRRTTDLDATLKWPNDILIGGRKVGGILVERIDTADGPAAVIGVGLNVSTTVDELPIPEASSLAIEGLAHPDRTALLLDILEVMAHDYSAWVHALGDPSTGLRRRYVDFSSTIGSEVRVALPGGHELVGTAIGIDEDGQLEVDTASGTRLVGAGDVVHVRPVP